MDAKEFLSHWRTSLMDTLDAERAKAGGPFVLVISDYYLHSCLEGLCLSALRELDRLRDARWITN